MKISKEMKEALEKTYMPLFNPFLPYRVLYLATCDREGNPNITVISFAKIIDNKIIIPDIALLKSRLNIEENPNISLIVALYRSYQPAGGFGTRILHTITRGLVSIDISLLGRIKLRILLTLYKIFKRFIPRIKYKISLRKEPKYFEFRGKAKIVRYGKTYENMNKFMKILFGKNFKLNGIVEIEIEEIKEKRLSDHAS